MTVTNIFCTLDIVAPARNCGFQEGLLPPKSTTTTQISGVATTEDLRANVT
ncbi:MAG: hypothetical protein ACHQ0Y_13240 [Thermodesulfovibrionales bacterium]